jgi:IS30 family transposase
MKKSITLLTQEDLDHIKHWAELKFSISEIATMLMVDVVEIRMALQDQKSDIAIAYNAGKVSSQIKRREKILELAEKGNEWAIKILDGYEVKQTEEELMP